MEFSPPQTIPPTQEPIFTDYLFNQKWDEEIEKYDQLIRANPRNVGAYYGRGNRNYELKRYQEAIADYSKMLDLEPNNALAYYNRGVSQYRAKNYNGAIADFSQAIAKNPNSSLLPQFYNNWGLAYSSAFFSETALAHFTIAIELNPQYALAYHNRGILHHQWLNYQEAIADYSRAIELAPSFVATYIYRGRAYYELIITH